MARTGAFDSIVLRPHPSENYETWQAWASDPGVEIQYQGSANVWMLAADMVLHPGCTTGIEALLLDQLGRQLCTRTRRRVRESGRPGERQRRERR